MSAFAPIRRCGSGRHWDRITGYDPKGDGKNPNRLPGVEQDDGDGLDFKIFDPRFTKTFDVCVIQIRPIVEGFELLNSTNYDTKRMGDFDIGAGPTLTNSSLPLVRDPNAVRFNDTFSPRESFRSA